MRSGYFIAVTAVALMACNRTDRQAVNEPAKKPNILVILSDDAGYHDFGFQGSDDLETPNLDRLAANGVIFTDAHVTASVCSPSRAGLITGRYQQRFGHEANSPPASLGMDTTETTIADAMKQAGYYTALFGKWHLGNETRYHPNQRGFDHFYGLLGGARNYFPSDYGAGNPRAMMLNQEFSEFNNGYLTDALGDSTVSLIQRIDEQPLFIFLSFTAVHTPMQARQDDLDRFEGHPRQTLAAMTFAMDRAVGKVIDALDAQNELENTLIFFLNDNGGSRFNDASNEPLKGHKGTKYEGGIRVPYLVTWPEKFNGGTTYDGLASSLDVFATSLAAAGTDQTPGKPLDGVNLIPYLNGEKSGPPHQQLFFRKEEEAAMREGKWKLIRLEDFGYALYNLEKDPDENLNLADANSGQLEKMKRSLQQWEQELMEPLWHESQDWREVTYDIHKALMQNNKPERVRP